MRRVAITGSSGYYGSKLIEWVRQAAPDLRLLGLDVRPPAGAAPHEFVGADLRSPAAKAALLRFQPDTIVHLAFVVNPIHDRDEMRAINIGGTTNVFDLVRLVRPARFLMASSATAYGAWSDNPIPIHEDWRLKSRASFQYAAEKTALDLAIQALADELPDVAIAWTRPAIVGGKGMSNYLSRLLLNLPIMPLPDGDDVPLQFVHEDDCVAATWEILRRDARGPFNVGPDDFLPLSKIARLTGRRAIRAPFWTLKCASAVWWGLRLPMYDFPPGVLDFVRHPWVVAPTRLQNELGFRFRYTAEETLLEMWAEHRRKKTAGPVTAPR